MPDSSRTHQELIEEIFLLKEKIQELELLDSERKRAEEALWERDIQFMKLSSWVPGVIYQFTKRPDGTYCVPFATEAIRDLYGCSPEDVREDISPIVSVILPEDLEIFFGSIEYSAKYMTNWTCEYRVQIPGKSIQWTFGNSTPEKLADGSITWYGFNTDITDRKKTEATLRESEEKYRILFDNANEAIFVAQDGKLVFLNSMTSQMIGYSPEELMGRSFIDFIYPDDQNLVAENYLKRLAGDDFQSRYEFRCIFRDGGILWVEIGAVRIDWAGRPATLNFVTDITERKHAEEALRESEERYRALVENASDIVFRTDDTGHLTFVNPATLRIMGYEEKEVIGRHCQTFIRPDMRKEVMKFLGRQFVKRIPNTYSEYPFIMKDGREIWLGQNIQLIFQEGKVVAFQAVARDITDRKRIEEALKESEKRYRELSIIDDLTQLYNSRHFYHQLKMEIDRVDRYGQPLTLLLLDLDDFKAFNDAYGHVEGDQVLFRLGQVVKRCLRQTDSAYRYGGEEFTVLLPMTTSQDGTVTAERIRTEFNEEIFSPAPGHDVRVTVSIGLAQYKTGEDMKVFVHRVDQLMYQGKKNGKDRVCCESSHHM